MPPVERGIRLNEEDLALLEQLLAASLPTAVLFDLPATEATKEVLTQSDEVESPPVTAEEYLTEYQLQQNPTKDELQMALENSGLTVGEAQQLLHKTRWIIPWDNPLHLAEVFHIMINFTDGAELSLRTEKVDHALSLRKLRKTDLILFRQALLLIGNQKKTLLSRDIRNNPNLLEGVTLRRLLMAHGYAPRLATQAVNGLVRHNFINPFEQAANEQSTEVIEMLRTAVNLEDFGEKVFNRRSFSIPGVIHHLGNIGFEALHDVFTKLENK
ncbi:MAG TPA: hypothetical protein VD999_04270 [Vitreimonas sp.]|nr:hypothetical protein [Vitreimonas sp.]